jgi:hypothetical protein
MSIRSYGFYWWAWAMLVGTSLVVALFGELLSAT